MPHYYLDFETTGLDPKKDEIITIQYQKISIADGTPEEPLKILKSWEYKSGELGILAALSIVMMKDNPFQFVPVGNNLDFEFRFLAAKVKHFIDKDIDAGYFHSRPHIDLKPVMIILNGGKFKGYSNVLNKSTNGSSVPKWYQNKEYEKIINYIIEEATAFTNFYGSISQLMFNNTLKQTVFASNGRIDDYV
jgi:hypothetical protein